MSLSRKFRRSLLLAVACLLLKPAAPLVMAEEPCGFYQGKTVRWIVPYSPGGGFDVCSRLLEPFIEKELGAEVKVENVTGAGGIVGSKILSRSDPDGLTLGIINGGSLLMASMTGKADAPSPLDDFTILGRIDRQRRVLYTGSSSPFKTMEDLLGNTGGNPVLAAITEVGAQSFISIAITSAFLNLSVNYVAGFPGSRESSLAVIRGDADISTVPFDSIRDRVEGGEIRLLMQIENEPRSYHPSLESVPAIGGIDGLAARWADPEGIDEAVANARALVALLGVGRLMAAPPDLGEDTRRCLDATFQGIMASQSFQEAAAAANRNLDPASADEALAVVQDAAGGSKTFVPIIQEAIGKVRK
jgi:tripartite-type tricarboxylate transporter receptor subunit TctC